MRNDFFQIAREPNGVAVLTMNRPERLNACSVEDHAEMGAIFRRLVEDDDVRAVVVTGAGKGFCVGGTFDLLAATNEDHAQHQRIMRDARELVYALIDFDKPLIAAVNGIAVGPGAILALLSDVIIMEEQARIADGHIRAALAAGDGGVIAWPLSIGLVQSKRYLLTGDDIDPHTALSLGLITETADRGAALDRAKEWANRLASGPQQAIRATKRSLNAWLRSGAVEYFEQSLGHESLTMKTEEFARALAGMQEGRFAIPADPKSER